MTGQFTFGDFFGRFDKWDADTRARMKKGMGQAAIQALNDADMDDPRVPHQEGTLRGSGGAYVNGVAINKLGAEAAAAGEMPRPDEVVAQVAFNSPYAAYQHEGMRADGTHVVREYSEEGVGAKFLEIPMAENADEYKQIVADALGGLM